MKNVRQTLFSAAALLLIGLPATAGPIQRSHIPAQPIWVLHVDVDALRSTQVGTFLLGELEKPEAQAKFAAFQVMFNFDPRKQLHGLTLYSNGSESRDGVLIAYADFDPDRLVTMVKAAKDYQSADHRNHLIHSWIDEKKKSQPRVYAALHGNKVLFGQQSSTVASGLDVLDGGANLQGSGLFPQLGTGTAFIQGASRKVEVPDSDPNAAILRRSKGVRFEAEEAAQKVNARITLEAGSEEIAGAVISIARGLSALMKLQTDRPVVAKLAEVVSINQESANVLFSWQIPAADVIDFLKAQAARKAGAQ